MSTFIVIFSKAQAQKPYTPSVHKQLVFHTAFSINSVPGLNTITCSKKQGFRALQFCVMRSRHITYERLSGVLPNCVTFSQYFFMPYMKQNFIIIINIIRKTKIFLCNKSMLSISVLQSQPRRCEPQNHSGIIKRSYWVQRTEVLQRNQNATLVGGGGVAGS